MYTGSDPSVIGLIAAIQENTAAQSAIRNAVTLQSTTPGLADSGNLNISGTAIATTFVGALTGTATNTSNVGDETAANVEAAVDTVQAATDAATAGTLALRNAGTGNISATSFTGALTGNASTATDLVSLAGATALAASLTASNVAATAKSNVVGGIPVFYYFDVPNSAGNVDIVFTFKTVITLAWFIKAGATGGASDASKLVNVAGAGDITSSVALGFISAPAVNVVQTINPTYSTISAGGTLRATQTKTTDCSGTWYVIGLIVV